VDVDLVVVSDAEAVAARGAQLLVEAAAAGEHIFFSGGSTPQRAYELAAVGDDDWSRSEVWWGDERCVPHDDDRSNFKLVDDSLLSRLTRPPALVHRIRSELGPEAAADEYHVLLDGVSPGLVLLGIGPDGHTASLTPGDPVLEVTDRRVAVTSGEYQGVRRMTLTYPELNRTRRLLWVVTGEEKVDALQKLIAQDPSTPSGAMRPEGESLILADRAAAPDP